jgi:short-subunit dehydrogenase
MTKTVLITGGSSGLGQELAFSYAQKGWDIFILARREELLKKTCEQIRKQHNSQAHYSVCDLRNPEDIIASCDKIKKIYPKLDLIIANAGVSKEMPVENFSSKEVISLYEVNVFGVIRIFEQFIPSLIKQKSGHLVAISSIAGFFSFAKSHPYCASKSALNSHMQGLGDELKKYNIHTTTICPGFIHTPMTKKNKFYMPLILNKDKAAQKIIAGISAKKRMLIFPLTSFLFGKFFSTIFRKLRTKN